MIITITSIRLRSVWQFFKLSWLGLKISRQAAAKTGFIQMKNTGSGRLHYTLSAWENEEAMRHFAFAEGEHKEAMKQSRALAEEIKTYTYQGSELPDWKTAKQLVAEKGKALKFAAFFLCMLLFGACQPNQNQTQNQPTTMKANITKTPFGTKTDGQTVDLYTLTNKNGVEAKITNYGGIVVSLKVPDRNGKLEDVVLGFDSLAPYVADNPYFGSLVGRYGNRIAKGKFTLDGKEYTLAKNNGENHLHGGLKGFDKVVWQATTSQTDSSASLTLQYLSKDMEEGYPGNLSTTVIYTLTNANELRIEYAATTDKKTVVNLTHHSYFNLSGDCKRDILGHEMMIAADGFTPVDAGLIPTGEIRSLDGSPLDFRHAKPIGKDINVEDDQLKFGQGYDHNWALRSWQQARGGGQLAVAATVFEPESGRFMEVLTTEPGLQFYSGNFLDGKVTGKGGKVYQDRVGFCLETQHFPDSPNHANFPSTVLEPGQAYRSQTVYRFSVK